MKAVNRAVIAGVSVLLLSVACSSSKTKTSAVAPSGPSSTAGPVQVAAPTSQKVTATLSDFKVQLSAASAPAGTIDFAAHNDGPSQHEFVVFKTDQAEDALPIDAATNAIDEKGPGVTHVDEIQQFDKGLTQELKVNLPAGRYVLVCNLPTHYKLGMHAVFQVQ